jgi:hypothetical protein
LRRRHARLGRPQICAKAVPLPSSERAPYRGQAVCNGSSFTLSPPPSCRRVAGSSSGARSTPEYTAVPCAPQSRHRLARP